MGEQGHPTLRHRWVHLFLNGTYWGVYDAVEQHDAEYAVRHQLESPPHLVEPDDEGEWSGVRAISGSASGWSEAILRLREKSNSGRAVSLHDWEALSAPFNKPALIDYILWNWWLANGDWPTRNWLASFESSQWNPLSWDAEMAMPLDTDVLPSLAVRLEADTAGPGAVFVILCEWPAFREKVARRLSTLTSETGVLAPAKIQRSWEAAAARFRPLVAAESARWGGQYQLPSLTAEDWENNIARVSRKFFLGRSIVLNQEVNAFLADMAQRVTSKLEKISGSEDWAGPPQLAPSVAIPLDSDGDRMPDEWELRYGLDPLDAADAMQDRDGDGAFNVDEFLRRTSPSQKDVFSSSQPEAASVHTKFPIHQRRRVVPAAR